VPIDSVAGKAGAARPGVSRPNVGFEAAARSLGDDWLPWSARFVTRDRRMRFTVPPRLRRIDKSAAK
jgi:hypothetical protein